MERINLTKEERKEMVRSLNGEDLLAYRVMQSMEYLTYAAGTVAVGISAVTPKLLAKYNEIPIDDTTPTSLLIAGTALLATAVTAGSMRIVEDHFLRRKYENPSWFSN